jgi:hypothetical protein
MKVTKEMKVKEVLDIGEHMLEAFAWLAPEFERLRKPALRKAMAGRVTVSQAARVAGLPLTEALYVLNIAAGESEEVLWAELSSLPRAAFDYQPENPPRKPREILGLTDTDERIVYVDVTPHAGHDEDPRPSIMRGLMALCDPDDVLLVRHPFDPVPLRDLFARRGFASWAEERRPHDWYIYFYRPAARAEAIARLPFTVGAFVRAVAAGA